MGERRLHLHLKTAPDRRDSSVLLCQTECRAIIFLLVCLLALAAPTLQAQSQGKAPATFSASEVERSCIEQAPLYRQRALTYPAEALAKSYFSEAYGIKTFSSRVKAGVVMFKDGTLQRVTEDNVDSYRKCYSDLFAIVSQAIPQRGFRQVGGTFVMNVGSNCEGFTDGTVSIAQRDFRIALVTGWPAVFDRLARIGGSAHFEGVVTEDTIAVGALGNMEEVMGLGKVEAGHVEINFGKCKVTLTPY
jgi:hypothetical protein